MGQALGIVLAQLPPEDAAKLAGEASQTLADALCGFNHVQSADYQAPPILANGIVALAGRLDAQNEAALARRLADAVTRTPNTMAMFGMARVLGSISGHLSSEDACNVAEALAVVMSRSSYAALSNQNVKEFADICARLEPADAAFITRALADALARNTSIPDSIVQAAAARLDHDSATGVADALAAAMVRRADAGRTAALARVLAVVLADLPADEAARRTRDAARRLTDAMKKTLEETAAADAPRQWMYGMAYEGMTSTWTALLDRLPPEEAAPLVRDAGRAAADAMKKAADETASPDAARISAGAGVLRHLAPALSELLKRSPPDEAVRLATGAAHALADAMQRAGDLATRTSLAPRWPRRSTPARGRGGASSAGRRARSWMPAGKRGTSTAWPTRRSGQGRCCVSCRARRPGR